MDKSIREFYEEVMMGDIIADYLSEGINDTAIFKAVFLAGGPGSGKSFIGTEKSSASKTLSPSVGGDPRIFMGGGQLGLINIGMRVVNPDPAYEKLLKAAGLDPKNSADIWSDKGQEIRVKATEITAKQKSLYVDGRLGVIIDGTGSNVSKVQGQKALLDKVGYECAMIYVNTDLQTAIDRDQNRSRTIGADKVSEMWNNVQKNLKKYESIFGKSNMYVIDNSNGADWHSGCKVVHKKLEKWIRRAPTDPKAKGWIESQKMRNMPKGGIRESVDEGFLDTFLGRNMKKGNVDKKKSKKSKNSEQVKLSTEIDRKLRLIDDLMKKVRPLGGNLGRLMAFRKLPIDKMTPKGMYVALNDWWDSIEADLDDDSEDDNEKYAQSAEKLYDLWEEVGFKLSDYMWASGYNVKGIGQMAKIGFPAKKRTDPEWLKMNESRVKNVVRGMGVDPDLVMRGMGKGPHAAKDKARAAKEPKKTLKSRAKNVARGMGVDPDNVMRGMGFKESSELPEGFMDTMKQLVPGAKGKPAKGNPAKKLNAEQVKISKQIDKKLKLIDNLVQKVRPLGGQINGLVRFSRLPLEKMTPKDLYRVLNDWYDSIEHELDYGDDSVVLSKKYGRSVENLHERMEELALKIKDYMYASGYDVPHGGAKFQYKWLNKVDFSAPKRTDAK